MKLFNVLIAFFFSLMISANVSAATAVEGVSYKPIVPAQATDSEGKIEIIEVFSYGCSHCHRFEPILERWLKTKPDNVEFVRLPAMFSPQLALYARAYYAAEALDAVDKVHKPFFDAVHLEKRNLNNEEAIADLFEENGVSRKRFLKAFRSPYVETKVRRAAELGKRYGIEATPAMVVNGKYRTNPGMGRIGYKGMIDVIEQLIEKEQKTL